MSEIQIDKLIRSHRKTIGLQITNDARLIVRAPHFSSEEFIHKLIKRKESWINAKLDYFKERQKKIISKQFIPGENFLFLGINYPLTVIRDLPKAIIFLHPEQNEGSLLISSMVLDNARDHIESWYKAQALVYITKRVEHFAQITGLKYLSIKVNNASTRWGSCGYKNTLNFTWRLIMAPPRVIDYVVVHELMHIRQKNHSRRFWNEVKTLIEDYQFDELWLKENNYFLAWPATI